MPEDSSRRVGKVASGKPDRSMGRDGTNDNGNL